MMTEPTPNPRPDPRSTILKVIVLLLLLIGFWLFATSALFVGKKLIDPYIDPTSAGSTTGPAFY